MAIEINGDKSLRRCVYKDPDGNSHEVEKIKVRYGRKGLTYSGLHIEYSFIMKKESCLLVIPSFPMVIPWPGMRYESSSTFGFWFYMNNSQTADNFMWGAVSSVYVKGRVYVDTGDGTVFYDGSFEKTFTLQSTEYPPKTGNHREIYKTEGYISVVTHISFDYIITYKDGIKRAGKYNNSFYAEYGVNAGSLMEFSGKAEVVPDINQGFENLVWQKDPLRVYRQQIELIEIADIYVRADLAGTYCGYDEYFYTNDAVTPMFFIALSSSSKEVKITNIKVTGTINILVDNEYILKQSDSTLNVSVDDDVQDFSFYMGKIEKEVGIYSSYDPKIAYYIKAEITYADGYVYTYNKQEDITIKCNKAFNQTIDTNIPALKN